MARNRIAQAAVLAAVFALITAALGLGQPWDGGILLAQAPAAGDQGPPVSADASPSASADDPLADIIDPFAGVFKNDVLTVELVYERAKEQFSGALKRGERSFPIAAKREAGTLKGHYTAGGRSFPFAATLEGNTLKFTAASSVFELTRQTPAPPAAPGTAPAPAPAPAPAKPTPARPDPPLPEPTPGPPVARPSAPAPADARNPLLDSPPPPLIEPAAPLVGPAMKPMRHPNGFSYRYPESWKLSSSPDQVYLFPDLTQRGVDGTPLEVCMITLRPSPQGAAAADDPKLMTFFDELMKVNAPFLKRKGQPQRLDTLLGPGTVVAYAGTSADGSESLANVYGAFDADKCFYMVHIGRRDLVEGRAKLVRHVFSTFGWQQGQPDSALVGRWTRADGQAALEFMKDGSCAAIDRPAVNAANPLLDLPPARRGDWTVARNRLYVTWEDGSADLYSYRIWAEGPDHATLELQANAEPASKYRK